ncbi:DUF6252 family protein [Aquimarina spongiae]|uniref:Uncharacterized protein n=1 Tax=Aquimarina spongiae TaxID=570521 RepID=A0A1M6KQJ8_9FLAO|nr:DUF6252 family protein [Aquimarina spongiae]SHJ61200.1 hypothetical protein SAMN04488508_11212 [Aquimarina spongiae]
MTKITTLFYVLLCLIITSCSKDIVINDPSLQAEIEGETFRTSIKKAVIYDDGTLVISGSEGERTISFTTSSTKLGTYKLDQQTVSKVSYKDYEKKFIPVDGETAGEVIITEIYNNEISGNFYFKNLKDDNGDIVDFNHGWFYRLPLESGNVDEEPEIEINPCLLNASLTALVDGNEMITDDHTADIFGVKDASILIRATNENSEIVIVMPADTTPGTYSLTGSGDYSATYAWRGDKSSALSGTLIISEHNTDTQCISGSFEFETRSGTQVTEGFFDFGY